MTNNRKLRTKLYAVLLVVALCVSTMGMAVYADDGLVDINIIHTNDLHGLTSNTANSVTWFGELAGYAEQSGVDLVLDAGDFFHGSAFATVDDGTSMAKLMRSAGFTAMSVGNHDFNYGVDRLLELANLSRVPVITGNVVYTETDERVFDKPYILTRKQGVRIAVFGVIDPEVYTSTAADKVADVEYTDMYEYAAEMVDLLRPKADVIVCVSHCVDYEGLAEVEGIDLLITGHLHEEIGEAVEGGAYVVQSGQYGTNVGLAAVTYNKRKGKVTDVETRLVPAKSIDVKPELAVMRRLDKIVYEQSSILGEVVGISPIEMNGDRSVQRLRPNDLANVVTDAYRYATGADVAFENGGGIRATLPEGEITRGDILNILPFGNYLWTKKISGKGIRDTLEIAIDIGIASNAAYGTDPANVPGNWGEFLHVSGMTVVYDPEAEEGSRIVSIMIGDEPIDDDAEYTMAVTNYLGSLELYTALVKAELITEYGVTDEILAQYIADCGVEEAIGEIRLQIKE